MTGTIGANLLASDPATPQPDAPLGPSVPFVGETPQLKTDAKYGDSSQNLLDILSAASEDSWMGAMVLESRDRNFVPVKGYDPAPFIEGEFKEHASYLLGSVSPEHFEFRKAVLARQMQNKKILAESPILGLAFALPTALGDPTSWMGAGWVLRGGTVAGVVGRSFVQGGATTGLQGVLATAFNPTGTLTDIVEWTLMGALGNSILGSGVATGASGRRLRINQAAGARSAPALLAEVPGVDYSPAADAAARAALYPGPSGWSAAHRLGAFVKDVFVDRPFPTQAKESLSSAANPYAPKAVDPEAIVPTGLGIEKFPMSPMVRGMLSGVDAVSRFMQDLAPAPMFLNKHLEGVAAPLSAQAAATMRFSTLAADFIKGIDQLYYDYRGIAGKPGPIKNTMVRVGDYMDRQDGRQMPLRPDEFRERISDQVFARTFDDPIAQVNEAAKKAVALYDEMAKHIDELGFFGPDWNKPRVWETLEGRITENYGGPMLWNIGDLQRNKDGFMADWLAWQGKLPQGHPHKALTPEQAWKAVTRDRRFVGIDDDMTGLASSLKQRELRVPYREFKRWLTRDAEQLARYYTRSVGTDIELARRSRRIRYDKDGNVKIGKADVSMRERIEEAKEGFMTRLDTAMEEKGAKVRLDEETGISIGPATNTIRAMHAGDRAIRARVQRMYAEGMEFIEGRKAAEELPDELRTVLGKMPKNADAELELVKTLRRMFDDEREANVAKHRKALGDEAAKYGLKRSEVDDVFEKMQKAERDMMDARDAIRGTLGQPDDPMGLTPRAARVAKQVANVTTLTGFLAAVPDIGNMVMTYGLRDTFGTIFDDVGRRFRAGASQLNKRELELAGTTLELQMNSRAAMMTDMTDVHGRYSRVERAVDDANNAFFLLSLTTPWTDLAQGWVGQLVINSVLDAAEKVKAGKPLSKRETASLARSGLDERMLRQIAEQPGREKVDGVWTIDTGKWDTEATEAMRAAILTDVDRVVVKSNRIEQPVWVSGPIGSVIGQYKGFAVAVTNRILIPALQMGDRQALTGAMALVAAGFLVDQIRHAQGGAANQDRPLITQIGRAVERSGLGGWFTDAGRAMDTLTDGRFGYGALIGESRNHKATDLLGPAAAKAGQLINVMQGVAGFETWTPTHSRDARGLLFLQNVAHMDFTFDAIQQAGGSDTLAVLDR